MAQALRIPFHEFDQRITIVSDSETADGYGGLTAPSETTVATEWAKMEFTSGNEYYQAGRITASGYYTFTLWFNSNITVKMKVALGTRRFGIQKINNIGMHNEYMQLLTEEIV